MILELPLRMLCSGKGAVPRTRAANHFDQINAGAPFPREMAGAPRLHGHRAILKSPRCEGDQEVKNTGSILFDAAAAGRAFARHLAAVFYFESP